MKYALLIVLALASTSYAQCVNCQVPTLAPQPTQSVLIPQTLSLQEVTVESRRPGILESMAIRQQSRQAARQARYPSVSATYSAGSAGTPTTYGSTGTPQTTQTTYSLSSTGTPQVTYSTPTFGSTGTPQAVYSTPPVTYSLGSTGTPTPACVCSPVCTCVNCNCAPAVFSAPVTPCLNCVAPPITYSVPAPVRSFATPVRSVSSTYAIALRSATERAMRGIKGHLSSIERQAGKRVGVGWSSHNPNPATCYNNLPGDYVSIRGSDGWYATKIVR